MLKMVIQQDLHCELSLNFHRKLHTVGTIRESDLAASRNDVSFQNFTRSFQFLMLFFRSRLVPAILLLLVSVQMAEGLKCYNGGKGGDNKKTVSVPCRGFANSLGAKRKQNCFIINFSAMIKHCVKEYFPNNVATYHCDMPNVPFGTQPVCQVCISVNPLVDKEKMFQEDGCRGNDDAGICCCSSDECNGAAELNAGSVILMAAAVMTLFYY